MSESLLHSLPNGCSKWQPTAQPLKVSADDDSSPEMEESSFDSSCDSINEENVQIKNISTMAQETTLIQRNIFIQRDIRRTRALSSLTTFLKCYIFRQHVIFLLYRAEFLDYLKAQNAARKISRFFKVFIHQKKLFNLAILEKYKEHCAIYIQKSFRGYIARKSYKIITEKKSKAKAVYLGWKTRKVFKHPEILQIISKFRSCPSKDIAEEFYIKYYELYSGKWANKMMIKVPPHRRILYKNNTLKLKISHERKHSAMSSDDCGQKETEGKKKVRWALKNSESPKYYEPNLSAIPRKSILKQKGSPLVVDWDSLQQKLDQLFYESEARLSIDGSATSFLLTEGSENIEKLLFKLKPRMKRKVHQEMMKGWQLDDFEFSCNEDQAEFQKFLPISISTKIPHLRPESFFFQSVDVHTLYTTYKKEYNSLRNGVKTLVSDAN